MSFIDEISPEYVGEDRIVVTLASDTAAKAFHPVQILIDYHACNPEGIVLPLEIFVRAPSNSACIRRVFRTNLPISWPFSPREGGPHLVLVRELFHNRWWGRLRLDVAGERLRMASAT